MPVYWSLWRKVWRSSDRRFTVHETTDGFAAQDRLVAQVQHFHTLAAAKAWCEMRGGGTLVHRANHAIEWPVPVIRGDEDR
jgi:hypothetical protein